MIQWKPIEEAKIVNGESKSLLLYCPDLQLPHGVQSEIWVIGSFSRGSWCDDDEGFELYPSHFSELNRPMETKETQ